jgi:transcriptional/translational regulatory protein YebC/TACO1
MFKQKGLLVVDKETGANEDDLMMLSIEAGAEDFKDNEEEFEITTAPNDFDKVLEVLTANNITTSVAQVTMIPETTIALTVEDAEKMMKLMEVLEDHDDVQEVYANFDIPEELMD